MTLAILTSSRADYGIYLPLLKRLKDNASFDLRIIAFGTHLSPFHGYTLNQLEQDGFEVHAAIESLVLGDSPEALSTGMALTMSKFATIWKQEEQDIDLILCLGDRFEMFAAVSASIPFNIPVGHIHGGETTLGAIDNTFRHCITQMSDYHFVATSDFANKVVELKGSDKNVYNVGALSLDNLLDMDLLSIEDFSEKYAIDMNKPTILVTFHPETVLLNRNAYFAHEIRCALEKSLTYFQVVITMPNADTYGNIIRQEFNDLGQQEKRVFIIENFGTQGYFTCMKHCRFLLGNTSSGIIEAASFGKYVINLGDRQKGRARSSNVIDVEIDRIAIENAIEQVTALNDYSGENIYHRKSASENILSILNKIPNAGD